MTPSTHPLVPPPGPAATPPVQAVVVLTARQLAAALGVSRRTITTWNQRGTIPSLRAGRVRRYELEQVRAALREQGQAAPVLTASSSSSSSGSGGCSSATCTAS